MSPRTARIILLVGTVVLLLVGMTIPVETNNHGIVSLTVLVGMSLGVGVLITAGLFAVGALIHVALGDSK